MSYAAAIVVAAGKGIRFKSKIPKPLVKLGAVPVIIRSLCVLDRHPEIKEIIVVANTLNRKSILKVIKEFHIKKVTHLVLGGSRRQDSVSNGLKAVSQKADLVLIHDAARPFIERKMISLVVAAAKKSGAAIAGVPVKDTVKKVTSQFLVEENIARENLWQIQTPQVFKKSLIQKAYARFGKYEVTDDASLVEKLGKKVSIVFGSYNNIKITTPEDLIIAECIVKKLWKHA